MLKLSKKLEDHRVQRFPHLTYDVNIIFLKKKKNLTILNPVEYTQLSSDHWY